MAGLENAERLSRIIQRIRSLPTLPAVYAKVHEAMRAPESSASQIARLIEADQALASKVLRLVNSSYFGLPRKITSLRQAIVLLGFNAVRNALLALSVVQAFGKDSRGDFDRVEFWKHALGTGATARFLSETWKIGSEEEAYVAGILHDIGKILLDQFLHAEFMQCLAISQMEGISLFDAERRVLGVTHCDVGEYLGEQWGLPPKLIEGIALHHRPKILRSDPKLVALVNLADTLTRQMAIGHSGNFGPTDFAPQCLEELGISEENVLALIPVLRTYFDTQEEMFELFT
ncbi:MAG: HDOD domain-containing protein [candidate division KSB1 bacterium]|nr:HDOD domain-containing protein [candidate division KSB1 bacterium]